VSSDPHPAVVIHSLADARNALAVGRAVTLLSAPGAALYAGSGWWRALIDAAHREYSSVPMRDILDCADASAFAIGAIRTGQKLLILQPDAPARQAVAAIAASHGAELLATRPPALDMAQRSTQRRLHEWLQQARQA
jgi:hypothetical protein